MKQKKERVTISNYQKLAMRTCMKSCCNKEYADFGFLSEQHEFLAKKYGYKAKQIRGDKDLSYDSIWQEIGDCFWFLALRCQLNKISFEYIFKTSINKITKEKKHIYSDVKIDIEALKSYCKDYKTTPLKCMQMNIDKLASRKERGKITGNGDNR